ncbi:MAG: gamma-glutamyltransferase [Vicinamibacterales bacterium]
MTFTRRLILVVLALSVAAGPSLLARQGPPAAPRGARVAPSTASQGESLGERPLITGQNGIVTSNHPLASAAGMRILMAGGNAFDAAVATAAATSVVDPANSTLGGNGFATIYVARTREVRTLNYFGTAPKASRPERFTKAALNEGILASPVPSNLRGYDELLKTYGTKPLAEVLSPAIELAERGFVVDRSFSRQIARAADTFRKYPSTARVYLPGGQPPAEGTIFRQPDYARTLKQVAAKGAGDFYSGDLARRIAAFYAAEGGILGLDDLREYQAKWVDPISITYRGYTIYTQPPNSSAIAMLAELNIMEGFDNARLGHNSAPYLHRFMEAMRLALADRNRFVADTDAVAVPIERLLAKPYAAARRRTIDPGRAAPVMHPGDLASTPDGDTTHLTVVDKDGNMAALTQTLGGSFGSIVVVGDTGLFFSNQMRHMHLEPDSPSKIRGGIRPRSNQSPTVILKDGQPFMAVGSPGGDGIWQRLAQVIVNVLDFDMTIQEAAAAPRVGYGGPQETGTAITPVWRVEDRVSPGVVRALEAMGHQIRLVPSEGGAVNGVVRDPRTGALTGGADPRGRSYAIGY